MKSLILIDLACIYIYIYNIFNTLSAGKGCLVAPGVPVPPWAADESRVSHVLSHVVWWKFIYVCMCVFLCVCVRVCAYTNICIHKLFIYIYIYIYICLCVPVWVNISMPICAYMLIGWLVGFCDISIFVGYLMPNPFYTNNQSHFK